MNNEQFDTLDSSVAQYDPMLTLSLNLDLPLPLTDNWLWLVKLLLLEIVLHGKWKKQNSQIKTTSTIQPYYFREYSKNKHTPLLNKHTVFKHMPFSIPSNYSTYLVLEYRLRLVSDSTLDADGTVDIGLTLRPPPVVTLPREHRKPGMLVHSVMMCCRSSSVISGMCGRDDSVLELLPILWLRICEKYPSEYHK